MVKTRSFYFPINSKYAGQTVNFPNNITIKFDPLDFPIFNDTYLKTEVNILNDAIVAEKGVNNMLGKEHMQAATRQLHFQMEQEAKVVGKSTKAYIVDKGYSSIQADAIIDEVSTIPDYTWHHHQETGRMQLVSRIAHEKARHNGGNSLWGKEVIPGEDD